MPECGTSYAGQSGLCRHVVASDSSDRKSLACSIHDESYEEIASSRHHERQAYGRRIRVKDKGLTPAEEAVSVRILTLRTKNSKLPWTLFVTETFEKLVRDFLTTELLLMAIIVMITMVVPQWGFFFVLKNV